MPLVVSVLAAVFLASAAPERVDAPGGVRSSNARIRAAIEEGRERSATFRDLVERLEGSSVILYVERGRCPCPKARSCLAFVTTTGGVRYVRAHVNLQQSQPRLIEEIGHELHHAWEVAEADQVTTRKAFARFYATLAGSGCHSQRCFETSRALLVERTVRREMSSRVGATRVQ